MARYGYEAARRAIVAYWEVGDGAVAATIATLSDDIPDGQGLRLAGALTGLSRWLWRCYTHPASSAGDPQETNSEAWRRSQYRLDFAEVLPALGTPNLPTRDGSLIVSYSPVEESAHQVGRILHGIDDARLSEQIAEEMRTEIDAVEAAERGEMTGRARQAVMLSRADASPVQVAAADDLLRREPLGSNELFTDVEPTAAAVAAAHWLLAAADVVARMSGIDASDVVMEADNIEALPIATPTLVLERLTAEETPYNVVTDLVAEAMDLAEGHLTDPLALVDKLNELDQGASELGDTTPEIPNQPLSQFKITPLDPTRPARDLLEDLLDGIRGCWLLYREYAEFDSESDQAGEYDEDQAAAALERIDDAFTDEVRAEAEANKERLI